MPSLLGDAIAPLIGAQAHEVIACDSTSVNLFKLIAAALAMRPGRKVVLSEPGNFPTDLYMIAGLEAQGLAERRLAERRQELVDARVGCAAGELFLDQHFHEHLVRVVAVDLVVVGDVVADQRGRSGGAEKSMTMGWSTGWRLPTALGTPLGVVVPGRITSIQQRPSGRITAYWFDGDVPAAAVIDPATGQGVGSADISPVQRWLTTLHRSLFLDDTGRIVVAIGAASMLLAGVVMKLGAYGCDAFSPNPYAVTHLNQPSTLHMHATR